MHKLRDSHAGALAESGTLCDGMILKTTDIRRRGGHRAERRTEQRPLEEAGRGARAGTTPDQLGLFLRDDVALFWTPRDTARCDKRRGPAHAIRSLRLRESGILLRKKITTS